MRHKIILLLLFGVGCYACKPRTGIYSGMPMPELKLLLLDSLSILNTNNISKGAPIVVFYFDPDCPFCQSMTKNMLADIGSMKHLRFYMISNFPIALLRDYSVRYELNKYSNITLGQDINDNFTKYFNIKTVPFIAIYNGKKSLKNIIPGMSSVALIKQIAFK